MMTDFDFDLLQSRTRYQLDVRVGDVVHTVLNKCSR